MHRIPALAALVAASCLIVAAMIAAPSDPSANLAYPAPGAQTPTAMDEPYPPTLPVGTVIFATPLATADPDATPPIEPTHPPHDPVYLPLIVNT